MGLIAWAVFGAVAGWLASVITKRSSQMGCLANIFIGVVGAIVGGFLANFIGAEGITGFNVQSMVVAVIGAVLLLAITGWRAAEQK